jgi:hypothetical protein
MAGWRGLRIRVRRARAPSLPALVLLALAGIGGLHPEAGAAGDLPRSALARPDRPDPVYVLGNLTTGMATAYGSLKPGYGVTLLFRPSKAAEFLGALYDWNTSLVLQADYRPVDDRRRLLAADFILRRYLGDMRTPGAGRSLFVGLGAGGAEVTWPVGADGSSSETWYSYLVECGLENTPRPGLVVCAKAQWRLYRHSGRDYSGWTLQIGAGIPAFW